MTPFPSFKEFVSAAIHKATSSESLTKYRAEERLRPTVHVTMSWNLISASCFFFRFDSSCS